MKVYHSNTAFGTQRLNKVKAVAALTGSQLQYEANEKAPILLKLFRPSLPVLETQQGALHSSNTIIRYLANSTQKLYGKNIHEATLVDQWLDNISFELEPAVAALTQAVEGSSAVAVFKAWQDSTTYLKFVNEQLAKNTYLVGGALSIADISLFVNLSVLFEFAFDAKQREQYPNLTKWFELIAKQIGNGLPAVKLCEKTHQNLACSRENKQTKGGEKKEKAEKKADKKGADTKQAAKKEDDFDLFGDDSAPAAKKEEKKADDFDLFGDDAAPSEKKEAPKPKAVEPKKEKKKAIPKSIVIFDVKVYEQDTNLEELANKIFTEITKDGLVWSKDYKILPVAYTVKKLQLSCVVEDDKVSTDDIFEVIESWEDVVQSVDIVSFQKV